MSYNYLPLDHKLLHIEQIENLLAYQQLLSITFTAHEQITSNSFHENEEKIIEILNYIDIKEQLNSSKNVSVQQLNEDVIRLMIAFKIKSLSYGKSGVSIETVKQLLHIYNHQIIPIIPPFHKSENIHALSSLCKMMNNNQQVYFSQKLLPIKSAFAETGFISKALNKQEILAISTGNQYTTACCYFTIQKAKKIIALFTQAFANCIQIIGYKKEHWQKTNFYNKKIDSEYQAVFEVFNKVIVDTNFEEKALQNDALSNIIHVLAHSKKALSNAIDCLLQEINLPSEYLVFDTNNSSTHKNANSYLASLQISIETLSKHLKRMLHAMVSVNEWLCNHTQIAVSYENIMEHDIVIKDHFDELIENMYTSLALNILLLQSIHKNKLIQLSIEPSLFKHTIAFNTSNENKISGTEIKQVKLWLLKHPLEDLL